MKKSKYFIFNWLIFIVLLLQIITNIESDKEIYHGLFYIFLTYFIVIGLASFMLCLSFYGKVQCKSKNNKILYSFDDGPDPIITPQILTILQKNNIKAIFFCIGKKAERYPHIIQDIINQGHQIGNHSYSHSHKFGFYSIKKLQYEIRFTNRILQKITNKKIKYFRPPAGIMNPKIYKVALAEKMIILGWSIRSFDTFLPQKFVLYILSKAQKNDIILLHDNRLKTISTLGIYCGKER
ncbi:MAG: polysaccharide deacetylase family protein [Gammaproteobacteria bacterium]|nr:MAG: polysaccharide deacetylase family protein [Gammaproteobacteria bacterium]